MSIQDSFNENDGILNAMDHIAAINPRNQQIALQKERAAAIREQTAALEAANRNEADHTKIEQQRLFIEQQRREDTNALKQGMMQELPSERTTLI